MQPQGNAYKMLGILQSYAPDGRTQQECANLVADMERDGCQERELVQNLAGIIYTGIRTGNWPWLTIIKSSVYRGGIEG